MNPNTQQIVARAPKMAGAKPTPIRLTAEELAEANEIAEIQERSRSSFMRSMYLKGLKQLKQELDI